MDKRKKYFLILYIIVEIVLILVGIIYVYVEGSCYAGSVCPKASEVVINGFVMSIIFGILAPILFLIWNRLQKRK